MTTMTTGRAGTATDRLDPGAASTPSPGMPAPPDGAAPGFLTAPFDRRSWQRYGYLWAVLLTAPFAFAYVVATVSLTAGLAITVVGLFVGGLLITGARGWGSAYRGMARSMLGAHIPEPPARRRTRGFWRTLGSMLGDAAGWRAMLFMLIMFPLSIVAFVVSTVFVALPLGLVTHWYWGRFLPEQQASDGTLHRGMELGPDWFVDTPQRHLLATALGLVLWFVWPWVVRLFTELARFLSLALLGPTRASLRVADLEDSRADAVEDADARLRRIERDLHDGTQARLVAVAMQLGEVKEHLDSGGDAADVRGLVRTAHASTTDALVELRELARGIHPPVLDGGLAVALETLAARAPLPVTVDVDPDLGRPGSTAPAVESIAYFCAAELVTNAAKHADARSVHVQVERHDGVVRLRVRDDGRGGAFVAAPDGSGNRSGLPGLAERVRTVDGTLDISSPHGGPTVVTVTLPETVRP